LQAITGKDKPVCTGDISTPGELCSHSLLLSIMLLVQRTVDFHIDPAQLGHDVGAGRQLGHMGAPLRIDLVGLAGLGSNADGPTEMVEDNRGVGKRPGKISNLWDLVVIAPGFKRQMGESRPEILAQE